MPGLQPLALGFIGSLSSGAFVFQIGLTTLLRGIAAIAISIGFAPEVPEFGDGGRQLAENLHSTALAAPAMRVEDPPWL